MKWMFYVLGKRLKLLEKDLKIVGILKWENKFSFFSYD